MLDVCNPPAALQPATHGAQFPVLGLEVSDRFGANRNPANETEILTQIVIAIEKIGIAVFTTSITVQWWWAPSPSGVRCFLDMADQFGELTNAENAGSTAQLRSGLDSVASNSWSRSKTLSIPTIF
ncbi:MAG: hypothetical protein ACI8TP_000360 [Acidimicrobiales bacterium]